ncbi:FHA domain-containing protein [Candidatus Uabimicrobium sp. HlEnr_7]|uniref:FHA domain-containing protein n=1 Tax=Candidatus Uabimicrobium helgolandensis TaxID=3095367 RepID=UPI003556717B
MALLIIMDGPQSGKTFNLKEINIIGKAKTCDIVISDLSTCNFEFEIERKNERYFVFPVETNILVNGHSITKKTKLIHGDMITVADILFLFGEEDACVPPHSNHPSEMNATPIIASTQAVNSTLEEILSTIENTKTPDKYKAIIYEVEKILEYHLEQRSVDVGKALKEVLEVLIDNDLGEHGLIFLKDKTSNKLWPMASL